MQKRVLFYLSVIALAIALLGEVVDGMTGHSFLAANYLHVVAAAIFMMVGIRLTIHLLVEKASYISVTSSGLVTMLFAILLSCLRSSAVSF